MCTTVENINISFLCKHFLLISEYQCMLLLNTSINTITHGPLQKKRSHGQKLSLAHKSVGILANGHEIVPNLCRPHGGKRT